MSFFFSYSLRIRTNIHRGDLTWEETKETEVRGLSGLRSFIYSRSVCWVPGSTRKNVKIGYEYNVLGGSALVMPTSRHRSLLKLRCLQMKVENITKAPAEGMGSWGLCSVSCPESSLPPSTCAVSHTCTEHGLPSEFLPVCPLYAFGLRLLRTRRPCHLWEHAAWKPPCPRYTFYLPIGSNYTKMICHYIT